MAESSVWLSTTSLKFCISSRLVKCAQFGWCGEIFGTFHENRCSVITHNIKDLYYSTAHDKLLSRLRNLLESELVSFQPIAGIPVEKVSCLLGVCLQATVIEADGKLLRQKKGIKAFALVLRQHRTFWRCSCNLLMVVWNCSLIRKQWAQFI